MRGTLFFQGSKGGFPVAFEGYQPPGCYDEMFAADGSPRADWGDLHRRLELFAREELLTKKAAAEAAMVRMGITFNVYGDEGGTEKIIPFDIVPRLIGASEWASLESGLVQRVQALNAFVADVYGDQKILKDRVIPSELVLRSPHFLKACVGLRPPQDIWCHISGIDIVRDGDGRFRVLEDNLRCPSGVSYVLKNRFIMKKTLPHVFQDMRVVPVDDYPVKLLEMLAYLSPRAERPVAVLLTPGRYNSAYFEHCFLAQKMGIGLVEGSDLVVHGGEVCMRTTSGLERVDVIYRRIDDEFLDPQVFRSDSLLGVAGLFEVYRRGKVALVNAPGVGVADNKALYAYVPEIIKYYTGAEPILPNVETFLARYKKQRQHILENLHKLVVKEVSGSGGYGMLIGPHSTAGQREEFARKIEQHPESYIAQPTLAISSAPSLVDGGFEPRHVDLRPFVLYGKGIYVLPGGLTRVALKKGSLVVNSSQGGGVKDTWVLS